ncbi:hypothetical protein MASR2M15_07030 [Anaerolineales bacterium]
MTNSAIIEVIIGILFTITLLSILITQVNNVITSLFKLRAKHLKMGLGQLISDEQIQAKLLTHPLIRMMKDQVTLPDQKLSDEQVNAIITGQVNDIRWISSRKFIDVLMNILRVDTDTELFGALLNIIDTMPSGAERRQLRLMVNRVVSTGDGFDDLRSYVLSMQNNVYRETLREAIELIDEEISGFGIEPDTLISLYAGLRKVKNPYFRNALETVIATARNIREAEERLEDWYNEGMDRVTTTFSKLMAKISIVVGILLAILLNADTINIGLTLYNDPIIRDTIVTVAANTDLSAAVNTTPTLPDGEGSLEEVAANLNDAQSSISTLLELRLPLGWYYEDLSQRDPTDGMIQTLYQDSRNLWNFFALGASPHLLQLWIAKLIGLGIMVIAIAQGAPFWFNILNRIMSGRSTS